jgi:hypothetical protein
MKNYFNRILVPVFFNHETKESLARVTEIANELGCDLHLLHVQVPSRIFPFFHNGYLSSSSFKTKFHESQVRMEQLVEECRGQLADGLLINGNVLAGSWQTHMKESIIKFDIDLVVIPARNGKATDVFRMLNINRLSQQTQCPVLTLTNDFVFGHLQNIVVPIKDFLPVRKLTAATFLSRKFNAMVHLLGQRGNTEALDKQHTDSLIKAYQLMSEYTSVKIHCFSEKRDTATAETMAYAKEVSAGLIVVNPGKESLFKSVFSRWLPKNLLIESNIPVLTISPRQ